MEPDLVALFAHALGEAQDASPESATDERIVDATVVEVAAQGARGATIDDIAARAGVGRVTVFRRFGSKDALVRRMVLRELERFLADVQRATASLDDPADRVVAAFLACLRAGREHPLAARVVRDDPGGVFVALTRGAPSALDLGVAFIAAQVTEIQRETGRVAGAPDEVADVLVRLALTYVLVPGTAGADEDTARAFARRVLVPIVLAP